VVGQSKYPEVIGDKGPRADRSTLKMVELRIQGIGLPSGLGPFGQPIAGAVALLTAISEGTQ
jgi:hypothetical protein